jgi:hypothetical protein
VQVVEHDHKRPPGGGAGEEGPDRVEEAESRLLVLGLRRLLDPQALGDVRYHPGDVGGTAAHLPAERHRVRLSNVGAQGLRPRPIGRRALALVTAAPMDLGASDPGIRGELLCRAGLADPRLAGEQDHPGPAGKGVVDGGS